MKTGHSGRLPSREFQDGFRIFSRAAPRAFNMRSPYLARVGQLLRDGFSNTHIARTLPVTGYVPKTLRRRLTQFGVIFKRDRCKDLPPRPRDVFSELMQRFAGIERCCPYCRSSDVQVSNRVVGCDFMFRCQSCGARDFGVQDKARCIVPRWHAQGRPRT